MIGATNQGKLITVNKKMFQADWDGAGGNEILTGINYPGYYINLVSVNLIRSTKVFASGETMKASQYPGQYILFNQGTTVPVEKGLFIIDQNTGGSFQDFFDTKECNFIMGYLFSSRPILTASTIRMQFQAGDTLVYNSNSAGDVYCYLSLAFYLTPQV